MDINRGGRDLAKEKSKLYELQNFDKVYSSSYVRAISTAKYFTSDNIIVDENFGERKFGINSWDELPQDFFERQYKDFDYKIGNGESINEVKKRQEKSLNAILSRDKNQKILIVGHSTALSALFSKWCRINYNNPYIYNNQKFFDGKWNYCELFKLEFDNDNNLVSITNIR